jgi:archaellum component FlaC
MVEKKNPDDNLFNDNFENDFDFGEEPSDTGTQSTVVKKSKPKTGILIISGSVVLLLTLYMGWKFLSKPSTSTNTLADKNLLSKTTEPTPKPQITEADLPKNETTVLSTPPILPSQVPPKIEAPKAEPIPEPKSEYGMNDIAQAFSSADQTPQPKDSSSTLKEIQKELFSSASSPPPVQNTDNRAHPEITGSQATTTDAIDAMVKLGQQMEYTVNQIKQLDAYTRDISQTIAKLNIDINAMDNRILALTNTTSALSKDMGVVKSEVGRNKQPGAAVVVREQFEEAYEEPVLKRKVAPGCPMPEEPEYIVHAVIPGRAWLKTSKGQIITVTEGETVGNYGKILVIDAANGVVLTNSGITFR